MTINNSGKKNKRKTPTLRILHKLDIYKAVVTLTKLLNKPIRHMPVDYRQVIGNEIRRSLFNLKFLLYRINSTTLNKERLPYFGEAMDEYNKLKICIEEAVDLDYLNLRGKNSIHTAMMKLSEIGGQLIKWHNYTKEVVRTANNKPKVETENDVLLKDFELPF